MTRNSASPVAGPARFTRLNSGNSSFDAASTTTFSPS